jgi:DUF2075 family protein
MIIYENNEKGFYDDVMGSSIVDRIMPNYIKTVGHRPNPGEEDSWRNSLRCVKDAINGNVPEDCGIFIEYKLPASGRRIDFIITGHDEDNNSNFVIIELKQWSSADKTDKEDLVMAPVHSRTKKEEADHPSYQAYSYKRFLSDMNEAIYKNNIRAYSCSYLHNFQERNPEPLRSEQYAKLIEDTPMFLEKDSQKLAHFLQKYVGKGNGMEILYEIENGHIKPCKKLVDCVAGLYEGNESFILLDEQKIAYANIMDCAHHAQRQKTTIIVDGGPGTGKSVVAMQTFVSILKENKNVRFIAPNASFKQAIIDMLSTRNGKTDKKNKDRAKMLFSGSASFTDSVKNEFDVLICDEAHRLKKKGAYMYQGISQVEDIIRASKVNVFFVDDNQQIRPTDEGSTARIIEAAGKFDSKVIKVDLKAQFRCAGEDGFINWITHTLQIEDTGNYDGWDQGTYQFGIYDTPQELVEKIHSLNTDSCNARLLAGFAWPWTSDKEGNRDAEVCDVSIPEYHFSMPWNSRKNQYDWARNNRKQDQIGCVHTSQGLEFDYVGIIIGNDLKYNPETHEVYASYADYYDAAGKKSLKNNPELLTKYIKNIYKVLLSRGTRGCFVFCRDKNLQEYMKERFIVAQNQ